MCCSILIMIIITQLPIRYIVFLGLSGILMIILMIISAPYRMKRIFAFLDPFQDPLGSGFQMIQSLYAIGPGGILGSGFDQSIQKHFYLPEPQTDFIFAIIGEELGFVGCCGGIILLLLLVIECILIGLKAKDTGGRIICGGVASLIGIQSFINVCVATMIFPNTGLSLPFVSY